MILKSADGVVTYLIIKVLQLYLPREHGEDALAPDFTLKWFRLHLFRKGRANLPQSSLSH